MPQTSRRLIRLISLNRKSRQPPRRTTGSDTKCRVFCTRPSGDAPAPEADANPVITPAQAEQTLLSLRAGSWVDLYSKHRWLRAQLIWASTKGTLFMFVSHGGQPHSMTKRSCERLIRERLLRPVDSHGVVAQALDAVASQVAATAHENETEESR